MKLALFYYNYLRQMSEKTFKQNKNIKFEEQKLSLPFNYFFRKTQKELFVKNFCIINLKIFLLCFLHRAR